MMRAQRILIALTVANAGMLVFSLARPPRTAAQGIVPVLRGRALEMVDTQGVSAPRSEYFRHSPKIPVGTTGYPESVLLRLLDSHNGPHIKLQTGTGKFTAGTFNIYGLIYRWARHIIPRKASGLQRRWTDYVRAIVIHENVGC